MCPQISGGEGWVSHMTRRRGGVTQREMDGSYDRRKSHMFSHMARARVTQQRKYFHDKRTTGVMAMSL